MERYPNQNKLLFQTHKTFIHLQNTNEDILNQIWKIFVPPLTIVKLIHMNSVVNCSIHMD